MGSAGWIVAPDRGTIQNMKPAVLLTMVASTCLLGWNTCPDLAAAHADIVSYGCDDLVVVGRIKDQTFTALPDNSDPIGESRITMTIDVSRVLVGRLNASSIPATIVAHAAARRDRDFIFVVHLQGDGRYAISQGWVLGYGDDPSLANHCD